MASNCIYISPQRVTLIQELRALAAPPARSRTKVLIAFLRDYNSDYSFPLTDMTDIDYVP